LAAVKEQLLRLRVKEFEMPPIKDGMIIGKRAPIGAEAMERCLTLLCTDDFTRLKLENDEIVDAIFIRSALLKRVSSERILELVRTSLKPMMTATEILMMDLQLEITLESKL
jgi:hypothetical protein